MNQIQLLLKTPSLEMLFAWSEMNQFLVVTLLHFIHCYHSFSRIKNLSTEHQLLKARLWKSVSRCSCNQAADICETFSMGLQGFLWRSEDLSTLLSIGNNVPSLKAHDELS